MIFSYKNINIFGAKPVDGYYNYNDELIVIKTPPCRFNINDDILTLMPEKDKFVNHEQFLYCIEHIINSIIVKKIDKTNIKFLITKDSKFFDVNKSLTDKESLVYDNCIISFSINDKGEFELRHFLLLEPNMAF